MLLGIFHIGISTESIKTNITISKISMNQAMKHFDLVQLSNRKTIKNK